MSRYDWPSPPRSGDDPAGRADHNSLLRPTADVESLGIVAPRPTKKAARRKRVAVPHNAPVGNEHLWFPIGPSAMTNGQAGGDPNVAGRIRDLQVEPVAGLRVYAASASGGLWFSADAGATWSPLDDFAQTPDRSTIGLVANALSCGAVHVIWGAAANGSADEIWVGTGEIHGGAGGLPGGKVNGIGFLHRTGGSWTVVKGELPAAAADTLRGETVFRIVADPGDAQQLVAATSKGIYVLPTGGAWTKSDGWPSSGDIDEHLPVEVLLTRQIGKIRVWVAEKGHLWAADAPATTALDPAALDFSEISLPDLTFGRIALAASADGNTIFVLGLRKKTAAEVAVAPKKGKSLPGAQLWSLNAGVAAIDSVVGTKLSGVPVDLFGATSNQSDYDMCIATHPTVVGRVYLGGSLVNTATGWNASLYRCDTTALPMVPELIGEGVHPDVHVLRVGPVVVGTDPKREFWVGCDGGLFHSDADGDHGTFLPRNDGLAVLQPGYVANHPTNPGLVAAGFQDNGTGHRVGDSVWRVEVKGDGGGLVWDPDLSLPPVSRYLCQNTYAHWESSDNVTTLPVSRNSVDADIIKSEAEEQKAALFYSGTDAVSLGPTDTHIAVGTNRVWYSRDFGATWVTLPTATDPRAGNPNDTQDVFKPHLNADDSTCSEDPPAVRAGIIAIKFATPSPTATDTRLRVVLLYFGGLVWITGTRALAGTGDFSWTKPTENAPIPKQSFRAPKSAETDALNNGADLKFLPTPGLVSDFAIHDPDAGPLGSCYVTTIGNKDFGTGTPGARLDTLWFFDGTDTWIPCGLRTESPNGTWIGPRISAPALGVVVDTVIGTGGGVDRSEVYVATSVGVVKGVLKIIGGPSYSWTWELFANGLPEAAVQDLSIRTYGKARLLRVALQSRGVFETDLASIISVPLTYLRVYPTDTRRLIPTALVGPTVVSRDDPPRWDQSPDVLIDRTGSLPAGPNEPQLLTLPPAIPGPLAAMRFPNRTPKVHVLVHHRWRESLVAADLRVVLLRHVLPDSGIVPLGGLWPALVTAAAGATPPASLPSGWSAASTTMWKSPDPAAPPIETRMPRAVTFDLSFPVATHPLGTKLVLLAVVLSASNMISAADLKITPTTDATTVEQLVSSSPHVGAVTIELA